MTQEEKQLQFVDLCSRLPYGVKVRIPELQKDAIYTLCGIGKDSISVKKENGSIYNVLNTIDAFPLLRSMSSMTEEEQKEYDLFFSYGEHGWDNYTIADEVPLVIDWLNKRMFDYRYLIPMGLSIEAPKNMYNV